MTLGDQPAFNWFDVGFWIAGFLFGVGVALIVLGHPKVA